jgi:hypothetical protein
MIKSELRVLYLVLPVGYFVSGDMLIVAGRHNPYKKPVMT